MYCIWNPLTNKIIKTQDVIFNEEETFNSNIEKLQESIQDELKNLSLQELKGFYESLQRPQEDSTIARALEIGTRSNYELFELLEDLEDLTEWVFTDIKALNLVAKADEALELMEDCDSYPTTLETLVSMFSVKHDATPQYHTAFAP